MWGGEDLRCPVCKKDFKEEEVIMVDTTCTITHSKCISAEDELPLKYLGPFNFFKHRYPHINV